MKTSSPSRSLILTADEVCDALAGRIVEIVKNVKPQPPIGWSKPPARLYEGYLNRWGCSQGEDSIKCPFGVNDTFRVREAFSLRYGNVWCYDADNREVNRWNDDEWTKVFEDWCAERIDDETPEPERLESVSARSMPLWASRLTIRITSVRVEHREGKWCWIVGVEVVKTA